MAEKVFFKGDLLKECRKKKGITIEKLAEETGISKSSIAMYENGYRKPSDKNKVILARFFGETIEFLFF